MTKKIVKIVFDDSLQPVEIDFEKCKQCLTVVNMFNDCMPADAVEFSFPFPDVEEFIVKKVVEWLEEEDKNGIHFDATEVVDLTKFSDWEKVFFSSMTVEQNLAFLYAANKLECTKMLHCGERYIASLMINKEEDELLKGFNLPPFTDEEKQQLKEFIEKSEWSREDSMQSLGAPSAAATNSTASTAVSSTSVTQNLDDDAEEGTSDSSFKSDMEE